MKSYTNQFSTAINTVIATTAILLTFSLVAFGQTSTVVTNSSSNPVPVRDVDAAKRQPLQETTVLSMARGDYAEDLPMALVGRSSVVPSGKRLVIEHVSARASMVGSRGATTNPKMVLSILATLGGEQTEYFFLLTETAVLPYHPATQDKRSSYVISQCNQAVKILADPGTQVIVRALLDSPVVADFGSTKGEVLRVTVSGYLEDAPVPRT